MVSGSFPGKIFPAVLLIACLYAALASAQPPPPDPTQQILVVIQASEDAWNEGDIPAFMEAYHRSETMRFASGGTVTSGWQPTLERYLSRYTDRSIMGTLEFSDLDVTLLGPESAMVFGKWELRREEDRPHGLTTLILRRFDDGWKIVHDHTSSAEE